MADDLDAIIRRQRAAATLALRVFADSVLGEAQRIVPLEEGTLAGSGDVEIVEREGYVDAVVYFSTPYAARQHEEAGWSHREGRQAKYLEEPMKRLAPKLTPAIAAAVRRVTPS